MRVRLGNCRTSALIEAFDKLWPRIEQALRSGERVVEIRYSGEFVWVAARSATAAGRSSPENAGQGRWATSPISSFRFLVTKEFCCLVEECGLQ
jgi:hypothetical protein